MASDYRRRPALLKIYRDGKWLPYYPGEDEVSACTDNLTKTVQAQRAARGTPEASEYFGTLGQLPPGWEFQSANDRTWLPEARRRDYTDNRYVKMRPAQPRVEKITWYSAQGRTHKSGVRIGSVGKANRYPNGVLFSGEATGIIAEGDKDGYVEVLAT